MTPAAEGQQSPIKPRPSHLEFAEHELPPLEVDDECVAVAGEALGGSDAEL
jgi:hypothetical protein